METSMLNLEAPHRMSKSGLVVIYLKRLLGLARGFGILILYLIYKMYINPDEEPSKFISYAPYGILAMILLLLVSGYIYYRNYVFYIDKNAQSFVLEQGLFAKEKTIIQLDKIFQVNIKQDVWHQVLDVYELEIETAGSVKAEVTIQALGENVAYALKQELLQQQSVESEQEQAIAQDAIATNSGTNATNLVRLGNKNIVVASLLSHYGEGLRVAIGVIILLFSQFREIFGVFSTQSDTDFILDTWDRFNLEELLVFLAIFLLVPFLVNIYRFLIKYYNAQYVVKGEQELLISYGLLTLQERIFKIQKLQELRVSSNSILKFFGLQFVTLAQSDNMQGAKNKGSVVLPGLKEEDFNKLQHLFFGQSIALGTPLRPLVRKLIIYLIFAIVFMSAVGLGLWFLEAPKPFLVLISIVLLIWIIQIICSFKNERLYIHPDFIVKRYGAFRKNFVIIQPHKLQNIILSRKVWQFKYGNIYFSTASGTLSASWYAYDMLKKIAEGYNQHNIHYPKPWM